MRIEDIFDKNKTVKENIDAIIEWCKREPNQSHWGKMLQHGFPEEYLRYDLKVLMLATSESNIKLSKSFELREDGTLKCKEAKIGRSNPEYERGYQAGYQEGISVVTQLYAQQLAAKQVQYIVVTQEKFDEIVGRERKPFEVKLPQNRVDEDIK